MAAARRPGSPEWRPRAASPPSCSLTDLPGDVLALVADPLALVRLRLALLADVGGHLTDLLLRGAANDDPGRQRDLELNPLRGLDRHRMGVAERQLQVPATQLRAVADALDLQ